MNPQGGVFLVVATKGDDPGVMFGTRDFDQAMDYARRWADGRFGIQVEHWDEDLRRGIYAPSATALQPWLSHFTDDCVREPERNEIAGSSVVVSIRETESGLVGMLAAVRSQPARTFWLDEFTSGRIVTFDTTAEQVWTMLDRYGIRVVERLYYDGIARAGQRLAGLLASRHGVRVVRLSVPRKTNSQGAYDARQMNQLFANSAGLVHPKCETFAEFCRTWSGAQSPIGDAGRYAVQMCDPPDGMKVRL